MRPVAIDGLESQTMDEKQITTVVDILWTDEDAVAQLAVLRSLGLPDAWIGAGFVRNRVWDTLIGRNTRTNQDDIDVVYYDDSDPDGAKETEIEARLSALVPGVIWQARNQRRMHRWRDKGDQPYRDTEDSLRYWLETPTAVAARLTNDERIELLAPYGLDDLLNLTCRPTPAGLRRADDYRKRLASKGWRQRWPEARFLEP
jgi:hypothetical protein